MNIGEEDSLEAVDAPASYELSHDRGWREYKTLAGVSVKWLKN